MTIFEEAKSLNQIFMDGVEAQVRQSGTWYLAGIVGSGYILAKNKVGNGILFGGIVGLSISGALGVYNIVKNLKTR